MKKIISVLLAVVIILSITVVAFAAYKGDIDKNNTVTAVDARIALQIAVGSKTPTSAEKKAADMDGNGNVTAVDARKILQVAVGLKPLEELPTTPNTPPNIGGGSGEDEIPWDEIINPK